jgi:hypothetical protein
MAIVIGAATQVDFYGRCAISAQWGYNPNTQRLYCIGEWAPREDLTFYKPTQTLNLTIYAPGPTYPTAPSEGCENANEVDAGVTPAACGGNVGGDISGSWFVNSYSYTKDDANMPGQESWSLQRWQNVPAPSTGGTFVEPTYVMRGISEGQGTPYSGIVFNGGTVTISTGQVSAGGFGKADDLEAGVVASVGGGASDTSIGQGSASIPYTPLYI